MPRAAAWLTEWSEANVQKADAREITGTLALIEAAHTI
jgi:hypothetical protein